MSDRHAVVTGAFSNIGAAAARELLTRGWRVTTLTNRPLRAGDDARIQRSPLRFDRDHLRASLAGADVLVNTYWIRFPHGRLGFDEAVEHSSLLFAAARDVGIRRIVHVSVSNPSLDSPLGYYSGKARVEDLLTTGPEGWSIVRPTLVVGPKDVLSGNIAWFLRRFPAIAVPRGVGYRLQPVLVGDVGRLLADRAAANRDDVVDAAGPDVLGFEQYVRLLGRAVGRTPPLVRVPPAMMLAALRTVGWGMRDTILTPEELAGLRDDLLVSAAPARCTSSVVEWLLAEGGAQLGRRYVNDTGPRFKGA